jgi:outer membrane receptor protein involved in Fe transport
MNIKFLFKSSFNFIILCMILLLMPISLFAQGTGKIVGVVTDAESGDPLPGVNIVILGSTMGAATDREGRYFILNVPVGTYDLEASMIGYTKVTKTNVLVTVDRIENINFSLKTSVLAGEEITVLAERDILHKEVSNSQLVVTSEQIIEVPATRSITDYVSRQAGVANNLGIRGGSADQTGAFVNGFAFVDSRMGEPDVSIPLSSIEQLSSLSGGFNAEYGNFRSGMIDITTKKGSPSKYSVRLDASKNNAHMKRFGYSIFDYRNYYLRPHLDPAVAFIGTNAAWVDDSYTKGQYASFTGWNELAENYNDGKTPEEQVTPLDLYLWDAWMHQIKVPFDELASMGFNVPADMQKKMNEHARKLEGSESDWNIDFGIGGPVPLIGEMFGGSTFYFSHNSNRYYYMQPQHRRNQDTHTSLLTLQTSLTKNLKLRINGLYQKKSGLNAGTRNPAFMSLTDPQTSDYTWAPNYPSGADRTTLNGGFELNGILNNKTFWNLSLNAESRKFRSVPPYLEAGLNLDEFEATGYYENNPDPRSNVSDPVIYFGPIPMNNMPYGFSTGRELVGGYQFTSYNQVYGISDRFSEDMEKTIDSTDVMSYRLKFDLSSQVTFHHLFKTGLEVQFTSIDHMLRSVRYAHLRNNYTLIWDRSPFQGGAFLQDQITYEGMVANLGLRADYYDPGGMWPTVDPYNAQAFGTSEQLENKYTTWDTLGILEPVKTHFTLSPRLGISFPVTQRSKFFFNYGHFRSLVPYEEMYIIENRPRVSLQALGNPNLEPPRTISYETGVGYNLFDQYLIQISGYYKDITGQQGNVQYNGESVGYDSYLNNNYQDIMGVELSINKNFGRWLTGWLNFDYMITKSGLIGTQDFWEDESKASYNDLYRAQESRPVARPRFRANVTFHSPLNWGPVFLGIKPLSDWKLSLLPIWVTGSYFTYNPLDNPHLENNMQWPDYHVWDMKLSKRFLVAGMGFEAYLNISNLFNNKIANFNRSFSSSSDEDEYFASLRLPMYESEKFDDLRTAFPGYYQPGDDKPGDLRSADKPYINDPNMKLWLYDEPRDIWFGVVFNF